MVSFSQGETLTVLTITQVAQLSLNSGALNNTDTIRQIFERLEDGNAVENVDQFLTEVEAGMTVGLSSALLSDRGLLCCPIVALSNDTIIWSSFYFQFNSPKFWNLMPLISLWIVHLPWSALPSPPSKKMTGNTGSLWDWRFSFKASGLWCSGYR